jgi:hypothetical protein
MSVLRRIANPDVVEEERTQNVEALSEYVTKEEGAANAVEAGAIETLTAILYGVEKNGRTHMLQALVDALSKPLPPIKVATYRALINIGVHAAFRAKVAGCGVLGLVSSTLMQKQHPVHVRCLMMRGVTVLACDAEPSPAPRDKRRAEEFSKLREQLVKVGAIKAMTGVISAVRPAPAASESEAATEAATATEAVGANTTQTAEGRTKQWQLARAAAETLSALSLDQQILDELSKQGAVAELLELVGECKRVREQVQAKEGRSDDGNETDDDDDELQHTADQAAVAAMVCLATISMRVDAASGTNAVTALIAPALRREGEGGSEAQSEEERVSRIKRVSRWFSSPADQSASGSLDQRSKRWIASSVLRLFTELCKHQPTTGQDQVDAAEGAAEGAAGTKPSLALEMLQAMEEDVLPHLHRERTLSSGIDGGDAGREVVAVTHAISLMLPRIGAGPCSGLSACARDCAEQIVGRHRLLSRVLFAQLEYLIAEQARSSQDQESREQQLQQQLDQRRQERQVQQTLDALATVFEGASKGVEQEATTTLSASMVRLLLSPSQGAMEEAVSMLQAYVNAISSSSGGSVERRWLVELCRVAHVEGALERVVRARATPNASASSSASLAPAPGLQGREKATATLHALRALDGWKQAKAAKEAAQAGVGAAAGLARAQEEKTKGNVLFRMGVYPAAEKAYTSALASLGDSGSGDDQELVDLRGACLLNLVRLQQSR